MNEKKLPNLRRALIIGLALGLLMILGAGLAFLLPEHQKAVALDRQTAQMEAEFLQKKAAGHPKSAPSTPPTPPAK